MNIVSDGADGLTAPRDYADLVREYRPVIMQRVRQWGFDAGVIEDVTQDVLVRLIQGNVLERYDPNLRFEFKGELRPARFKTFFIKTVDQHLRGFRDREMRRNIREVLICDAQCGEGDNSVPWIELHGPAEPPVDEEIIDYEDHMQQREDLRAWLAAIPARGPADHLDLVKLHVAVCEQIDTYGEILAGDLAKQFKISLTTIHVWLHMLREYEWEWRVEFLGQALPYPRRRPRTTKSKNQQGG